MSEIYKGLFLSLVVLGLSTACSENTKEFQKTQEDSFETQVIYGDDNRRDWYEADSAYLDLADSTVGLFQKNTLVERSNSYEVQVSDPGWCSDEPFSTQGTSAFCSGFLVGPDLVVTAGHCIRSERSCSGTLFAFGFALKSKNHDYTNLSKDDVYECAEIIAREETRTGSDFAVIRLDREVQNHQPLSIRRSGEINRDEDVVVIGHPSGLPSKVADGAQVRSIASSHFVTNLDTYGGNSGSAVFNANTGEVEGILVRGDNDFVYRNGCVRSNYCSEDGCRGEDVTKISEVLSYVPELSVDSDPGTDEDNDSGNTNEDSSLFQQDTQVVIPDNNRNGLASELTVNEAVNGRRIQVRVNLQHPYIGDLVVGLVAPSGQTVRLHNRQGGNQENLVGTYGMDLISDESLDILSNEAAGLWQLIIIDLAYMDSGQLNSWALQFKN